ncbi:MAG TPA: AAA family ATPase [Candidatus Elarobacter sp.]
MIERTGNTLPRETFLPKGVHRSRALPSPALAALWDSIVVEERIKTRLLSQAVLNFTIRAKVSRTVLPLHGVILLIGPPGTGKTSLALGLADRVARSFSAPAFQLLEVDPHILASSAMGKTQRSVSELFAQSIAEASSAGPTIVLLDEVETLAVDRSKVSFEANPVDVHRATDAVLVQLDALAEQYPHLLFVATSNFPQAIDDAFTSRCDLIMEIPLPDRDACAKILADCLTGLGAMFPPIGKIATSREFPVCAAECVGLDGRAVRKIVANALASSPTVAMDPGSVTSADLLRAAREAKIARVKEGVKA